MRFAAPTDVDDFNTQQMVVQLEAHSYLISRIGGTAVHPTIKIIEASRGLKTLHQ